MIEIAGYKFDAAISVESSLESEITSHPVEDGSDITDHVRRLPKPLTIEFIVSDTPIGEMIEERRGILDEGILPSDDARAFLETIHETGEVVQVVTTKRTYEDMILESLDLPESAEIGDALVGTATFRQIVIVKNIRTRVRVDQPRGKRKKIAGQQASTHVSGPATIDPNNGRQVIYLVFSDGRGEYWYANSNGTPYRPLSPEELDDLNGAEARREAQIDLDTPGNLNQPRFYNRDGDLLTRNPGTGQLIGPDGRAEPFPWYYGTGVD